jgi:hypothetical protein
MYSQMSMEGEPSTDACKLGTHMTLGLISIIDDLKSMERDPMKGVLNFASLTIILK